MELTVSSLEGRRAAGVSLRLRFRLPRRLPLLLTSLLLLPVVRVVDVVVPASSVLDVSEPSLEVVRLSFTYWKSKSLPKIFRSCILF